MGSLWRSEDMTLIQMTMQREAAHDTVDKLGELGLVEFKDLSSHLNAFQRQYANQVKRCEDLERIVRFFEEQLHKSEIKNNPAMNEYDNVVNNDISEESLDDLESRFNDYEQELRQLQNSLDQMLTEKNKSEELLYVIRHAEHYRDETSSDSTSSADASSTLLDPDRDLNASSSIRQSGSLASLNGVIPSDKIPVFSMLVFRATRGNSIPRFVDIGEDLFDARTKKFVPKSVFTIYFGANRARDKIRKICESLGASIHDVPDVDVHSAQVQLDQRIDDINVTINSTKDRVRTILGEISGQLISWKKKVAKEKAIYHTLNLFDYKIQNSVIAEAWCPKKHLELVRMKMDEAISTSGSQVQSLCEELVTTEVPPTYFELNKFTAAFQDIVNAYGVPQYKEMNPGVMTIITFPFLFAVMFGDFGHGTILALFSIFLVVFEKKLKALAENDEMFGMIYHGRYVLLLMGFFSIYTGLLYNDCFGLSFNLFKSNIADWDEDKWEHYTKDSPKPATYVFGVDPAWYGTTNKLQYYNSMKMKMSVIYGVSQMMLGIVFSACNHVYFGHYIDIFVEFIPEVFILMCTFGYMDFLIIFKWCRDWRQRTPGTKVPGILATMTDFFLNPWGLNEEPVFYSGKAQLTVQLVCLILAAVSIPVLLFPKPIYEYWTHRKKVKKGRGSKAFRRLEEDSVDDDEMEDEVIEVESAHSEEDEEGFSEMFIKQLIHTIEFALGAVSNTASYLRLWALSLAHAQLSEVFYDMTINILFTLTSQSDSAAMKMVDKYLINTGIAFVPIFAIWLAATLGVLLGMESLSAFLHALRLHWVEFQGKFYKGNGHLFTPLDYTEVLKAAAKEREFEE
jgi:V-type H+-transporting ATPase subunit a